MPATPQERGERGADEAARTGHGDPLRCESVVLMAGEVGGGDSVPIGKHAIDRLLRQSVSDPAEWTKG
jgi:hypothetical protein